MEIRGLFRSHSHLPIWEVMEKAGIWEQNGLKVSFEFCDSSEAAEKALFGGDVDFVSGNHISPYLLVKRGKPIVCLSSPSNSVNDRLVTRFALKQVSELRGKRHRRYDARSIPSADIITARGNHMLYVCARRIEIRRDVEWVELSESEQRIQSACRWTPLKCEQESTPIFVTGNTDKFEQAGLHARWHWIGCR